MNKQKRDHPQKPLRNLFFAVVSIISALVFCFGFLSLSKGSALGIPALIICGVLLIYSIFIYVRAKKL